MAVLGGPDLPGRRRARIGRADEGHDDPQRAQDECNRGEPRDLRVAGLPLPEAARAAALELPPAAAGTGSIALSRLRRQDPRASSSGGQTPAARRFRDRHAPL